MTNKPTWVPLVSQLLDSVDGRTLVWVHTLVGIAMMKRLPQPASQPKPEPKPKPKRKQRYTKRDKAYWQALKNGKATLHAVPKNGRAKRKHAA